MLNKQQILDLSEQSMRLGFTMGVTSTRVKIMETLAPYIDAEILGSKLLTASDIIQMVLDIMKEFDADQEFEKMRTIMKGLQDL